MSEIHISMSVEGDVKKGVVKRAMRETEAMAGAESWDVEVNVAPEMTSPTGRYSPRSVNASFWTSDYDWTTTLGALLINTEGVRRVLLKVEDEDENDLWGKVWVNRTVYPFISELVPPNLGSMVDGALEALDDGQWSDAFETMELIKAMLDLGSEL